MKTKNDLEDKCRMLLGLPPHHGFNTCQGDGYFGKSIKRDFGKQAMNDMLKNLEPELITFRNLGKSPTCRLNAQSPNIQNILIHTERGDKLIEMLSKLNGG